MSASAEIGPGDLVEIGTGRGRALVQVTHVHPTFSEVVRALPGLAEETPDGLAAAAAREALFVAMVPLASAMRAGRLVARKLGRAPLPETARRFPTFRTPIRGKEDGAPAGIAYWWLWDGESLAFETDPARGAELLPLREVLPVEEFLRRLDAARP